MIRLRRVEVGQWTVLAMCDDRGDCRVLELVDGLLVDSKRDYDQVVALLKRTAAHGPPRSERLSRKLTDDIYELKTRGGIRIPYFYDEGRMIICTEALRKPKKTELRSVITRAQAERQRYLEAKRRGGIEVIWEDS